MTRFLRHLDLQAKISFVLVAVILPTFLIATIAQHQVTLPILEEDIKQIGINSGKTLAAEIDSARMLSQPHPLPIIENAVQDLLFTQPNISRIDVLIKEPSTGLIKNIVSNIEDEPGTPAPVTALVDSVTSELKDEANSNVWDIYVPIEHHSRDPRGPRRLLGNIHVVISTKLIGKIGNTLWKTSASAAAISVICLILALRYFLKKTIANDRLLRKAEYYNIQLAEQLHEAQRQLMNKEKLAVMGQLTASFAHEIGTPLNAIGGHLQLLKDELPKGGSPTIDERFEVMSGQLDKIEAIVKSFLQSTAKPTTQKQLVDVNRLIERTLEIIKPRTESMGIRIKSEFDRSMGPLRLVPLDLEQILLNLLNNSLDSLRAKNKLQERVSYHLELNTKQAIVKGKDWVQISVLDRGEGIKKTNLTHVLKPFFTTKRPGEGTGLGLTICEQLAHKYGGEFLIDSKEGAWTRVIVRLPYHANA